MKKTMMHPKITKSGMHPNFPGCRIVPPDSGRGLLVDGLDVPVEGFCCALGFWRLRGVDARCCFSLGGDAFLRRDERITFFFSFDI
jgi:hypothetical protein